jgi:hypothetical protein
LFDAYHVPKLLPQQLLLFGRSGDGLGVLTFGVEQFSVLFVPRGRSARARRTVHAHSVRRVLARLRFRSVVFLSFGWASFRTVCMYRADSPRLPGGQSACSPQTVRYSGSLLEVLVAFSDGPRLKAERSAARVRTVRDKLPDSPRGLCGQSAPPGRTFRQCLAALFFHSIPSSFLSCFRPCFKESFLRLEVDP